jgi:molybdopterin converting factor small subunit
MQVRLLFFGATAEAVGKREIILALDRPAVASEAVQMITDEHPGIKRHKLLTALNQEYVTGDTLLSDGDELAIFTAVSGG